MLIIPTRGEAGERLTVEGTVYRDGKTPAAGVLLYAYHTNAGGAQVARICQWTTTARQRLQRQRVFLSCPGDVVSCRHLKRS